MWIKRIAFAGPVAAALCAGAVQAAPDCPPIQPDLLLTSCSAPTKARLVMLERGAGAPDLAEPEAGEERLVVTGAYTSGERHEPEGLAIFDGAPHDPYPQGWDGVLLIDGHGALSLHHVRRVRIGDRRYDLKDRAERRAFLEQVRARRVSAIQSHLLVTDGALDASPVEDAPRFRRRVLFTTADGAYGLFDSSPRRLTLYEAAVEVRRRFNPEMAFNLDMGSYDYCARATHGGAHECGALSRAETGKLSNILVFSQTPPKPAARPEDRAAMAAEESR